MNNVNTSEAVIGLAMLLTWLFIFILAIFNPTWYFSFGLGLYSVWVGSYVNELGMRYKAVWSR